MSNLIITIGRQFGSGGRQIGKRLAEELGIDFYDRALITAAAKKSGFSEELFEMIRKVNNGQKDVNSDGTGNTIKVSTPYKVRY